jgi:hypothetical protein
MSEKDENSSCILSSRMVNVASKGETSPTEKMLLLHLRRQAKETLEFVDRVLEHRNEKQVK